MGVRVVLRRAQIIRRFQNRKMHGCLCDLTHIQVEGWVFKASYSSLVPFDLWSHDQSHAACFLLITLVLLQEGLMGRATCWQASCTTFQWKALMPIPTSHPSPLLTTYILRWAVSLLPLLHFLLVALACHPMPVLHSSNFPSLLLFQLTCLYFFYPFPLLSFLISCQLSLYSQFLVLNPFCTLSSLLPLIPAHFSLYLHRFLLSSIGVALSFLPFTAQL